MNLSSLLYRGRHYLAGVLIVALPLWHLGIGPKLPEAGVARSMIPTAVLALSAARSRRRRRDRPELVEASASYSRYSSDLQHEVSIESQQRDCNDRATRDGQPVAPQLQFKDEAISGTKLERDGLNELLDAAEAGRFNRLYFFSLSRLARESVIGMSLLKRLVNVFKIRVISVSEGFDSAQPGWEVLAQVLFMQHERYIKELSANSFRGQSLNITKNYSNGDYCFGYCGEPIPGTEAGRRGRKALPRMAYAIDPITSVFVRQIFHWFVHERRAIRWIVRRLNELNAPKDHRATTPKWTHACVRTVLTSRKYVGDWPWGERKNNRDADTGDVFQELRAPEEAEKYRRQMPELRLIDDETFQKAQEFLAENRRRAAMGRNEDGEFVPGRNGGDNRLGSHLLSGLIVCGTCGRKLHVGGAAGKYLVCPAYVQGVCRAKTQLNRLLAERLILTQVSARLLADEVWFDEVLRRTHAAWAARQQTLPGEIQQLEDSLREIDGKIARLVDSIENQAVPDPDVSRRLALRREERRKLTEQLLTARGTQALQPAEPTEPWVRAKLAALDETLRKASPAAGYALRELVGGRIVVDEVPIPGRVRCYYRGTLRLSGNYAAAMLANDRSLAQHEATSEEVVIEFREPDECDLFAERAHQLVDMENMSFGEATQRLRGEGHGISNSMVAAAYRRYYQLRGEKPPKRPYNNGRPRKTSGKMAEKIADEVVRLMNSSEETLHLDEIARRLGVDRHHVTDAIETWHRSRGLEVPDGRNRRKELGLPDRRRA